MTRVSLDSIAESIATYFMTNFVSELVDTPDDCWGHYFSEFNKELTTLVEHKLDAKMKEKKQIPFAVTFTDVDADCIEHLVSSIPCLSDGESTVTIPTDCWDQVPDYIKSQLKMAEIDMAGLPR